jgi:hypothetical protein
MFSLHIFITYMMKTLHTFSSKVASCTRRSVINALQTATLAILFVCCAGLSLSAQNLYQFTNASSGTPNFVASGLTATNLTRGPGLSGAALECTGATQGFSADGFGAATFNAAQTADDYIEFTLVPNAGNTLNITRIEVKPRQQNIAPLGPNRIRFAYSLDGGATFTNNGANLNTSALPCGNSGVLLRSWAITGITGHAGNVIFRIYGFRTTGATLGGDMTLTDLVVKGTLNCITPVAFNVSPATRTVCSGNGTTIDLSGSQTGTTYTLRRNGNPFPSAGSPMTLTGTGAALTFTLPSPLTAGTYSIVASNGPTCTTTMAGTTVITVNPSPSASITTSPNTNPVTICNGNSITLTASPSGQTYLWSTGATTAAITQTPSLTTYYDVTVTSANSCTSTATRTVNVNSVPNTYNVVGLGVNCNTSSVELDDSDLGVPYTLLRNGSPLVPTVSVMGTGDAITFGNFSQPGTYTVVTNQTACNVSMNGSVVIVNSAVLSMNVAGPSTAECGDEIEVRINVSGFCDMKALQYRINWNVNALDYVLGSLTMPMIGGSAPMLGQNPAASNPGGFFTCAWTDVTGACDGNLNANSSIMVLRFRAKGCAALASSITITPGVIAQNCANATVQTTISNLAITVDDTTPPLQYTTIAPVLDEECEAVLNPIADEDLSLFFSDCNTLTITPSTPQVFTTQGVHVANWTVSDGCGNTATYSQSVTIRDVTPPSVTCPDDITIDTEPNKCSAVYYDYANQISASDDCLNPPMLSFSNGHAPSFDFPKGSHTITITATDNGGNTDDCVFSLTVQDLQPPTINCPNDFVEYAGSLSCDITLPLTDARLQVQANDNCPGEIIEFRQAPNPFGTLPSSVTLTPGVNTLAYRVTDAEGASRNCSFQVTILDNLSPRLTMTGLFGMTPTSPLPPNNACPNGITFEANTNFYDCMSQWLGFVLNSSDNCTNPPIIDVANGNLNRGTIYPYNAQLSAGTHQFSYSVSDGSNPPTLCAFTVIVRDAAPPTLTCPSDVTVSTALCNVIAMWTAPTGSDNCGTPTVSQIGGQSSGSVFQTGTHVITYRAVDGAGRSSTCAFNVIVSETTPPNIVSCPSNLSIDVSLGATCTSTIPDLTTTSGLSASDNCSATAPVTWVQSPLAGTPGPSVHNGTTSVTLRARDGSGNLSTGSCVFTVRARDNSAPAITCPSSRTVPVNNNVCYATLPASQLDLTVTDNCGFTVTYTVSAPTAGSGTGNVPAGTQFSPGANVITYVASDAATSRTCTFTITVQSCTRIRGNILWAFNTSLGISNATVTLTPGGATDLSNASGGYAVFPANAGTYTITPSRSLNPLSGITTADVNRINTHISGFVAYPSTLVGAYQRIASDVDGNNTINVLDASELQDALNGDPEAQANLDWTFIPTNYTSLPTTYPSLAAVPTGYPTTRSAATGSGNHDFIGIKIGDVDYGFAPGLTPTLPTFAFSTADRTLVAGDEIDVDFNALPYADVAALQLAMSFNPAQLQLIDAQGLGGVLNLQARDFGLYQAGQGEVRVTMAHMQGTQVTAPSAAFRLRFRVLEGGNLLSEVLALDQQILPAHVYNTPLHEGGVQVLFTPESTSSATDVAALSPKMQLFQNQPNPFDDNTVIGFVMPETTEAVLNVYDQSGRRVHSITGNYAAGYHTIALDRSVLRTSGVYHYELVTATERLTRKMVVFSKP